jgi:hypothetical protein
MNTLLLASMNDHKYQEAFFAMGALASAFAVGAALVVSLLGIFYMTLVIAPNATQKFSGALREHNIKSFFAGLGTALVMVVSVAITHRSHELTMLLLTVFGATLIPAFAAGAEDIGRRLYWACGKEGTRAAHLASGWLVFAFGSLFPVIGWFVILPYVTLSGLGSLVVGALSSSRARAAQQDIEFPEEK